MRNGCLKRFLHTGAVPGGNIPIMQYGAVNGRLVADGVDLVELADSVGTPCYVYSAESIRTNWQAYDDALGSRAHRVCYAVKANDNLSILALLDGLGSGFDIVSGGELERVRAIGADMQSVVFSGVGKTRAEIEFAIDSEIGCFNIESAEELDRLADASSRKGRTVDVALRVNPDVDPGTHPYIATGLKDSKFGVPIAEAEALYRRIDSNSSLRAVGVACHIGSQLSSAEPVAQAVSDVVALVDRLSTLGIELEHIDVGGGLGIVYHDEVMPTIDSFVQTIKAIVPERYTVVVEPGRSIVGPAGLLLTRVEYIKRAATRNFIVVDAAMNDLIRPALYEAWHEVAACQVRDTPAITGDIVGPVCESGDWLARDRSLAVAPGDCLAIKNTGAYGSVMASNYNARPRRRQC